MSLIDKTGKSKGFAFTVTPEKVHQNLLIGRKILIKEAISTRKKNSENVNRNRRPNFLVNNFPENENLFRQLRLVPGNKFYATDVSEREVNPRYEKRNFSRRPQREKNFIIGDSLLRKIKN